MREIPKAAMEKINDFMGRKGKLLYYTIEDDGARMVCCTAICLCGGLDSLRFMRVFPIGLNDDGSLHYEISIDREIDVEDLKKAPAAFGPSALWRCEQYA